MSVLQQQRQPEPLLQGRIHPCSYVVYYKFGPYHLDVAADIDSHIGHIENIHMDTSV